MEILISDRQNLKVDKSLIKKLSQYVLEKENVDVRSELSVSLVKADEIKGLNKKYRNIDKPTDVLSFSFNAGDENGLILGDVIFCVDLTRKVAKNHDTSFDDYFRLLIVHSILHLLGYSHETEEHARVMINKENQLLKTFSIESK